MIIGEPVETVAGFTADDNIEQKQTENLLELVEIIEYILTEISFAIIVHYTEITLLGVDIAVAVKF